MKNYFAFLIIAALWMSCSTKETAEQSTNPPSLPNILYIMIDDLGWMDVGYQNSEYHTPNIDRLATEGMVFSNAYAAAPVCSPTRAAAMTGLAPARLRITNHIPDRWQFYKGKEMGPGKSVNQLDPSYTTIAERLRDAGYGTGFIGKWHLSGAQYDGLPAEYMPKNHGFDLNIAGCARGGPGGENSFFDPYTIPTIENQSPGQYLPDRLADEAIDFIQSQKEQDKPFFLCLWNYTVHWPVEAPDSLVRKYAPEGQSNLHQEFQAMVEGMDQAVGKVLKALEEMDLTDDTFVLFTSDNGPFVGDEGEITSTAPLKDSKGYLAEGGIRVPLVIRWPGKISRGSTSTEPVITMDFVPTFLKIAEVSFTREEFDGEDLSPILMESGDLVRESIFFHYPHYAFHKDNRMGSVIRKGDYKLIKYFEDGSVELYNLKEDLSESVNLAEQQTELAEDLLAELEEWLEETDAQLPRDPESIADDELFGNR